MAVSINLTPSTLNSADYPTAQTPLLGGELQVYLATKNSRLLGTALLTADGVISYKYVALPTSSNDNLRGPIVVAAIGGGIFQTAADTITFAGLTGSMTNAGWSSHVDYNFPVSRAVELTGTYSAPASSSVPTLSLGAGSGMLAGSQFAILELPKLSDFILAGCTTNRDVTIPSRGTKNIACGLNEAEWTTPGMVKVGNLDITGLNQGYDDGLLRYSGVKCQAMLVALRENRLITSRSFCLDWTGEAKTPYPTGDAEATVQLTGQFSRMAVLPAP